MVTIAMEKVSPSTLVYDRLMRQFMKNQFQVGKITKGKAKMDDQAMNLHPVDQM